MTDLLDSRILEFMLHAPEEPQPWFVPEMKESQPKPIYKDWISGQLYHSREAILDDNVEECDIIVENQNSLNEWNKEYTKQLYVQWPRAWARAVLNAGGLLHE